MNKKRQAMAVVLALLAAIFYAINTPFSKILLNQIPTLLIPAAVKMQQLTMRLSKEIKQKTLTTLAAIMFLTTQPMIRMLILRVRIPAANQVKKISVNQIRAIPVLIISLQQVVITPITLTNRIMIIFLITKQRATIM